MKTADLILKSLFIGAVSIVGAGVGRWAFLLTTDTPSRFYHQAVAIEMVWVAPFAAVPVMMLTVRFLVSERRYSIGQLRKISKRRNLTASTQASFIEVMEYLEEEQR